MKQFIKRIPEGVKVFLGILAIFFLPMVLGALQVTERLSAFLFPAHSWSFCLFWIMIPFLAWLTNKKPLDGYFTIDGLIALRRLLMFLVISCSVFCMYYLAKLVNGLLGKPVYRNFELWWISIDWQGLIAGVFMIGLPILTAKFMSKAIDKQKKQIQTFDTWED